MAENPSPTSDPLNELRQAAYGKGAGVPSNRPMDPLSELRNAAYGTGIDMPNPKPIDIGINESLVGNFDTGPNPSKRNYNDNLGKDILNYLSQSDQWANDPNRFAKIYDYGADWKHTNFERYYNHDAFKELGFSPYRDNDATYNEKGSAWDDFNRAMIGNMKLFGHGFISMEESGESAAEAMERINATYGSTRGGVGGFMSNLALSAGYTQGILGRLFLEEAALALATLGSGFMASEFTVPAMGVELGRGIRGLAAGFKNLGKTYTTFKQLDNIDRARQIFNAVKAVPGAVGRGLLPHSTAMIADVKAGKLAFQGFNDLKTYARAFRGFGNMYQDYREFALAYSEAAMEGKMLENKMNDDLINDFYAKNGFMPSGEEAEKIYKASVNAGTANKMLNAGLIYFSNKLLFGKLLKGIPTGGELLTKAVSTPLGDLKKLPLKLGENFYKAAQDGLLKRAGKAVISSPYSPLSRSYWVANFVEGLQEVAQDASAQGFEDYYKNIYAHPMQAGYAEMLDSLARGTGKQFNERGMETFLSGFLTGALIGPGQYFVSEVLPTHSRRVVPEKLRDKWGITSYDDLVKLRNESKANTLKSINEVLRDPNKMDMSTRDYFVQVLNHSKKIDEAYRSGDPVKIQEATSEMYSDHLHRVFRTGNAPALREYFREASKMSDQELTEAFNQPIENAKDLRNRMNSLKERVDKFEKIYDAVEKRFPSVIDETQYKKGSPEYIAAVKRARSFEQAKKVAMFAMDYFQEATKSQKDAMEYLMANKPLENMNPTDISTLFDIKSIDDYVDTLNKEIRVLKQGDAKQKQMAAEKQTMANDLSNFRSSVQYFEKVSELFRKTEGKEEQRQELKDLSKIGIGSVVINAKGKKFKVVDTSGDILKLEDEKGKRYSRKTRKGLRMLAEAQEAEMVLDKENPVEFAVAEMFKTFKTYLKNRAKVGDQVLMDDSIEKAFSKIREFYYYKNNAKSMAGVVNALHDVKGMMALAVRLETANKALEDKFDQYAEEAFKGHENAKDYKALLNKLYDKSLRLVLPEGINSLMNKEVPKQFLDEATGTIIDETNNPTKYNEAAAIVKKFFEFQNAQEESDKTEKAKKEEEVKKAEEERKKKEAEEKGVKLAPVSAEMPEEKKPTPKKKVEYDTPYEQMPEKLQKAVIEGARAAGIAEGIIDEDSSEDEITATDWFRNQYLKYKHVQNQIDKYNKAEGFAEREPAVKPKAEVKPTTTPTTTVKPPTTTIKPTTTDIEKRKQEDLENKVKELEAQRKALRSEDGSIPTDKMSEFKRLNEEVNKAKAATLRGDSTMSMLIKMFPEGADKATTDPEILSAEAKKEAADIIEQVIQNSKSADEALRKINRLGYVFDMNVTQNLKLYLDDRFNPDAPKIGNNKDSFQAWIYGKTDAELATLGGAKPTVSDKKANIEIITNVDKLKNLNQVFQSPAGKFGILSAKDNKTIIFSDTLEKAIEKADIERRRSSSLRNITQTSLNFDAGRGYAGKYNLPGTEIIDSNGKPSGLFKTEIIREDTREEVEKELNAKYDAELTALEGAKEEGKPAGKLTPMQQYKADKESKPKSGLAPQIIYSTSTTGKTALANKYNDIEDGDFLLYEYLVDQGIVKEETDPNMLDSTIQRAGRDFYNYLTALKSSKGVEAANKVVSEVISKLQDAAKDGVVLTSNYWMLNQDMARFVSKDVEKIAEKLMARDPLMTKEAAEEAANKLVERETQSFKGRRVTEIPSGKTLEDMLFPSEKAGFQEKTMKKIENAELNTLKEIENSLSNLSREELLEANFPELRKAINDRKLILLRKFDYDSIEEGDMFLDPQGDLIEIVMKGKTMLGGKYVEDEMGKSISINRDNMDKILAYRYIEDVQIEIPEEAASTESKEAAKGTIDNSNAITKAEDSEIANESQNAKIGSGFTDLEKKKDDLNNNCPS